MQCGALRCAAEGCREVVCGAARGGAVRWGVMCGVACKDQRGSQNRADWNCLARCIKK